jgi:hypothetical protein
LNAGFASVWYINDKNENVQENSIIKPLKKELLNSFCCTRACQQLYFLVKLNHVVKSSRFFKRNRYFGR